MSLIRLDWKEGSWKIWRVERKQEDLEGGKEAAATWEFMYVFADLTCLVG